MSDIVKGLWWKIKALHRHFYDFYECLPRSQETSSPLRGFVSLVFQVLSLGCHHIIRHFFAFSHPSAWSRLWTWVQRSSSDSLPGPPLWALPPSFQRASTTTADWTHDSTLGNGKAEGARACQSRSWRDVTRDHRLDATSASSNGRSVFLMFFFPLLDLWRLHHLLLDGNVRED